VSTCELIHFCNIQQMAFHYKPVSRWTKKRRLQGSLTRALHAIETALSDSDDDSNKEVYSDVKQVL